MSYRIGERPWRSSGHSHYYSQAPLDRVVGSDRAPIMDQIAFLKGRLYPPAIQGNQSRYGEPVGNTSTLWQTLHLNLTQRIGHAFPWNFKEDVKRGLLISGQLSWLCFWTDSFWNFWKQSSYLVVLPHTDILYSLIKHLIFYTKTCIDEVTLKNMFKIYLLLANRHLSKITMRKLLGTTACLILLLLFYKNDLCWASRSVLE